MKGLKTIELAAFVGAFFATIYWLIFVALGALSGTLGIGPWPLVAVLLGYWAFVLLISWASDRSRTERQTEDKLTYGQ